MRRRGLKSEQSQRVESSKTSVSSKSVDPLPLTPDRMRQEIEELRRDLEELKREVIWRCPPSED